MKNNKNLGQTLTKQEKDFCELYALGCDPYAGNARLCYMEVYGDSGKTVLKEARELLDRKEIQEYIQYLDSLGGYEVSELKKRLTEKLLRIIDETSQSEYTDRFGTVLSPAPLRSVAVQAAKVLMDMYPIRAAQEAKVELNGGGESGIVFNVIMPDKNKDKDNSNTDEL